MTEGLAFLPTSEIRKYQDKALQALVAYLQATSPFYQELFRTNKIDIRSITALEDLIHIPTTGKEDISQRNADFLCVEKNKIADYSTTSGTLGKPVKIALREGVHIEEAA